MSQRNFSHISNFIFGTNMLGEETQYNIQGCNLPGVSISHIKTNKNSQSLFLQGDTIEYNPLEIELILDEGLETWKDIMSKFEHMREQQEGTGEILQSGSWLLIQDDNSNNILKINFYNTIINSIGDLKFSTTSEDNNITLSISISYDYYTIGK